MNQQDRKQDPPLESLHRAADEQRKLRTLQEATAEQERTARTPAEKRAARTLREAAKLQQQTAQAAIKDAVSAGWTQHSVARATGTSRAWVWTLVANDRKGQEQ